MSECFVGRVNVRMKKRYSLTLALFLSVWLFWWYAFPKQLFTQPYATVLFDADNKLMDARIARDEQWRFPPITDALPNRYKVALLTYEDKSFYAHSGIRLGSIFRALKQNWEAGKVVSGASTLSMQVIRLSSPGTSRTIWQKLKELLLAMRLEVSYTKEEILQLYATHAPFGGNIIGLEAASWRYFKRAPAQLSWAEAAMLAVLPNAPGLLYPGKSAELLKAKRNRLLKQLYLAGHLSKTSLQLAQLEPIPTGPFYYPKKAPHALQYLINEQDEGQTFQTTLIDAVQDKTADLLKRYHNLYKGNKIKNAALLLIRNSDGAVLSYHGNVPDLPNQFLGDNNLVNRPRSSGSLLKPLLYAWAMEEAEITPYTLLPDYPMRLGVYSPENYHLSFEGAVPANEVVYRSLNVPSVKLLNQFGVNRFLHRLKSAGVSTMPKSASHYGLSLILGGAEITLWEMAGIYRKLSVGLGEHLSAMHLLRASAKKDRHPLGLSAGVKYQVLATLSKVVRPQTEVGWDFFSNQHKISWKTGTSYGGKDAWAIGLNKTYTVAVWVGNANGEGRPELTGAAYAAPIMFETFQGLTDNIWFNRPEGDFTTLNLCRHSGMLAGKHCVVANYSIPQSTRTAKACPYCQPVWLSVKDTNTRVAVDCAPAHDRIVRSWFVLPPLMEWYYKHTYADYRELPKWALACQTAHEQHGISIIYPYRNSHIKQAQDVNGIQQQTIFKASHRQVNVSLFWHVDEQFIGTTSGIHQQSVRLTKGKHVLTLIDEFGARVSRTFEVF